MTEAFDPDEVNLPRAAVDLPSGERLESWTVVSHIADGGTSSVYRARYTGLRTEELPAEAALKITPIPGPEVAARLIDEYRKAKEVEDNPHIVSVYDAFETPRPDVGSCVVLVHELGEESLEHRIQDHGPLDQSPLKKLASDLVRGMSALHEAQIIHSDIKPANVLRFTTGWKLADLGTAAVMRPLATTGDKSGAILIGATMFYATPELVRALLDGREAPRLHRDADIWAFGLVMHEAASGRRPFPSLMSIANEEPDLDESLPANLRAIITACLASSGNRLRSADQLRQLLIEQGYWDEEPGLDKPDQPKPDLEDRTTTHRNRAWPYKNTEIQETVAKDEFKSGAQPTPTATSQKRGFALAAVLAAVFVFLGGGLLVARFFSGEDSERPTTPGLEPLAPASCSDSDDVDDNQLSIRFVEGGLASDDIRFAAVQAAVSEVQAVAEAEDGSDLSPAVILSKTIGGNGTTVDQIGDLTGDCVDAVVTNLVSAASIDILPDVTGSGTIQFSVNSTSPVLSDADDSGLFFRTAPSDEIQGRLLATRLRSSELDKTRAAVVYLNDDYGSALKAEFENSFEGGERLPRVIAEYAFDEAGPIDASEIERLVTAEPDAIVVIGFPENSAEVLRLLAEQNYEFNSDAQSVWLVDGNVGVADYLDNPRLAAGIRQTVPGAEVDGDALRSLREKLELNSGERLASYTAQSYDAVIILALAAAAAKSGRAVDIAAQVNGITKDGQKCETYEACLRVLETGQNIDYDGVGGPYELTAKGEPYEAIYQIDVLGTNGRADSQQSELTRETLCEICEANALERQITFADGSSSIAGFETELEEIAEIINDAQVEQVLIEGYASTAGSRANNDQLAQERAKEVHDQLVDLGVPNGKITDIGRGEEDRFLDNRTVLFTEP